MIFLFLEGSVVLSVFDFEEMLSLILITFFGGPECLISLLELLLGVIRSLLMLWVSMSKLVRGVSLELWQLRELEPKLEQSWDVVGINIMAPRPR